jgi:two-component system chemotaxis response regulator CheB
MPDAINPSPQRIRILVTASKPASVQQLAIKLASDPGLDIATAASSVELFNQVAATRPAVVLMDTEIAGQYTPLLVHGLAHQRQIPVVIHSDATAQSVPLLLNALERGALAVAVKQDGNQDSFNTTALLIRKLRAAASAVMPNLLRLAPVPSEDIPDRRNPQRPAPTAPPQDRRLPVALVPQIDPVEFRHVDFNSRSNFLLTIFAGIGGLNALTGILSQLSTGAPGVIAVPPIPPHLIEGWIQHMTRRCRAEVKQATHGDAIRTGQILIVPQGFHATVCRGNSGWTLSLETGPTVAQQKPNIDVLCHSLAKNVGCSAIAVALSGIGDDGVDGFVQLRKSGARTIVEAEHTSVCGELPASLARSGAAETTTPAECVAAKLVEFTSTMALQSAA